MIQRSLKIEHYLYKNNTFWDWQKGRVFSVCLAPNGQPWREPGLYPQYRSGYHPGKRSRKRQVFRPGSYWYNPKSWLVHSIIWKSSPSTWNGRIKFWKRFFICRLFWSSSNGKRWWGPIRWNVWLVQTDLGTYQSTEVDTGYWCSDCLNLGNWCTTGSYYWVYKQIGLEY